MSSATNKPAGIGMMPARVVWRHLLERSKREFIMRAVTCMKRNDLAALGDFTIEGYADTYAPQSWDRLPFELRRQLLITLLEINSEVTARS